MGWTDRGANATAGTFTWTLEIDGSGVDGADEPLILKFTDVGTDLEVEGANNANCSGLGDLNIEVSGLTITFSGTIGSGGCSALFAGYDPDGDAGTTADGAGNGDEVAFKITLAEAPRTTLVNVDDAEDQEIDVTGTVTITRRWKMTRSPQRITSQERSHTNPPTITTTKANQ